MTHPLPSAGWYPNGAVLRWWDGYRWTHLTQPLPVRTTPTEQVSVNPRLYTERTLVFRNKAGLVVSREWSIADRDGTPLGALVPIGVRAAERLSGQRVELRDERDALIHTITEEVVRFKIVASIAGLGKVTQNWSSSKPRFTLSDADDNVLGTIEATESWSHRFVIRDAEDWQIGRMEWDTVPLGRFGMVGAYEIGVHLDRLPADPLAGLVFATVPRIQHTIIVRRNV
ncbi:DUF2510 domain-containing protein [Nocardia huaxiensis]|uniref:DUF2510 domain-containing protein n=1 Tax=Nocardia huaxiensis TaxID=2755382 RepID=A0A7D6VMC6_9NOCA|nr:DUF2510 domain-containing protein [Nocardia huaxiensis]QLY32930.1 DUF2510 domain-containing protein [Nocardia huaxiensis]